MKGNWSASVLLSALLFCFTVSSSKALNEEFQTQSEQRAEFARLAGYGEERLSSVLITGTLFCDPCSSLEHGSKLASSSSSSSSYVTGGEVAVACKVDGGGRRKHVHAVTDEYGEFIIDLPSQLHAIQIADDCTVEVLGVPKVSACRPTSSTRARRISLSSVGNNIRVYSAGTIRLGHKIKSSVPPECSKKYTKQQ